MFENWDSSLTANEILDVFAGRQVSLYRLDRSAPFKRSSSKLVKVLAMLTSGLAGRAQYRYFLTKILPTEADQDLRVIWFCTYHDDQHYLRKGE